MLRLKRVVEALTDSSHTSIMYNMADNLKKKGWDVSYNERLGMTVNFDFTDYNPAKTASGKQWLKDNQGKTFVFKAEGKSGFWQWNVEKKADGKRYLTTKNVTVGRDTNLTSLQKKLPAPKVDGKLTGKSVKPFVKPEDVLVTNMLTPTFQSFLKKFRDKIISDIALALCEVVEEPVKEESYSSRKYFIDYDSEGNRINEGYVVESDNKNEEDDKDLDVKIENINWNDADVQDKIVGAIGDLKVDTGKTTKDKLVFVHKGKNGSLHLQGYMLVLDLDTDDDVPPTYLKLDKPNLTVKSLLETVVQIFQRRESLNKVKESKKESYSSFDLKEQSDELADDKPDPVYYILSGDSADPSVGMMDTQWNEIVGDENGYKDKQDALNKARELYNSFPDHRYTRFGITYDPVDISHFIYDTFWDAIDDGKIRVEDIFSEENESLCVKESIEDHTQFHDSPVFLDVAQGRFLDQISDSLIVAPECKGECVMQNRDPNSKVIWVYLSPSYAINQLSDLVIPVCITGNTLSMPMADIPNPDSVFNGEYSANSMDDYDAEVQNFIMNDAPLSDLMELNLDNVDEAKARVVDVVNSMAEDYQHNKALLENSLSITGESLLHVSRYYIIPTEADPSTMEEEDIKKITPMGFTDLKIAKSTMTDLASNGKYPYGLSILDTQFSKSNKNWQKL